MRRVLLAVDESDGAGRAAEFVDRFFGGDGDVELTAVNVARAPIVWGAAPAGWVVPFGAVYGWPWGPAGPEQQAVDQAMERAEREAASVAEEQAPPDAEVEVVFGNPVDAIQLAAIEHDADLIVVGSNHKNLLQRWFTGSVSDEVVRHAPCPVLVVS